MQLSQLTMRMLFRLPLLNSVDIREAVKLSIVRLEPENTPSYWLRL